MKRTSGKKRKPGRRIAVVEEVADNIYSIKFILLSLGYEVGSFSAVSPRWREKLVEFRPALVIVDMMIPNRGGYDAIRGIRKIRGLGAPILAITADAMQGEQEDVRKAGAGDILAKPYAVGDLQRKLEHWLPEDDEARE